MLVTKLSDPFILNLKVQLEGLRVQLNYRNRLQYLYKKSYTEAQKNSGGFDSTKANAMIQWNKTYINSLILGIKATKLLLKELYEQERKVFYLAKGRERENQ